VAEEVKQAETVVEQPEEIVVKKKKSSAFSFSLGKVSPLDVAFSVRHLALMLKSGLSITAGLKIIIDQCSNSKLKDAYENILVDVQSGKTMSSAMQSYKSIFSGMVISIIAIGEQAGTLESNLMFLSEYLKKAYELQRKVKGALMYPLIIFGVTIAEMLGVVFFILPKMDSLFKSFKNIPAFTIKVLAIAAFFRTNFLFIIGGIVVLAIASSLYFKTKGGRKTKDQIGLSFPVMKNVNKGSMLANISRTLSVLLGSGIPLSKALKITAETVSNVVYSEKLMEVYEQVKSGKTLATALMKYPKLFPITFVKMIEAGEKTGTLEDNLLYMYDSYSGEVEDMANNLTTLLEPILLVIVGLMIGLLAMTIVAPIYQLTGSINA